MAKAVEIPVYLFTGFLEGGKTRFIRETLEDKKFNAGEHTLLVLCEEGEDFAAALVVIAGQLLVSVKDAGERGEGV